ncbi:serine/threonine protein kinase [Polyangium aurulentum]|uniref:serine/threonine protein kinase n=1 Tax=Polyangium aurulentum TaxID=2567896 RepID=UPI0010AE670D|nr:serine/threonine-protein kinase [Polyangium aurulentum]UQA55559.1 serine/threonine protein kinase [Polyangium aurulentum]
MPAPARRSSLHDAAFGKYRLIASLGRGGMADVFLAVVMGPAGFSKLQVVKRLREELAEDREHLGMFLDEARLAARLNHPNVVQTFEVGEEKGEYYLAMEYLEGVPLNRIAARARKNPAPEGVLLRILADTLAGLHYAHELTNYDGTPLNIVHRDASPHNIFVTYAGQAKLVDFGIAKAAMSSIDTRAGVLKGKITYMAPEQARVEPLDRRADVFVIGIVLWEMLTSCRMWSHQAELEVLQRLSEGDLPRLRDFRRDVPAALEAICTRALAPDRKDRYATAAEMRNDILAYMDSAGLKVSSEDVGRYVSELFADKHKEIKSIIEQQLAKLDAPAEEAAIPEIVQMPDAEPMSLRPAPPAAPGSKPTAVTSKPTGVVKKPAEGAPDKGSASAKKSKAAPKKAAIRSNAAPESESKETILIGSEPAASGQGRFVAVGAAVIFAAAGAFFFFRAHKAAQAPVPSPAPAAVATVAAPAPAPTPAPQAAPASTATAVPQGRMIEITVRAYPSYAKVYLDGAQLPSNPFTGKFPADGVSHRLHADAFEHLTTGKIVVFDRDSSIDLVLKSRAKSGDAPATLDEADPYAPSSEGAKPASSEASPRPVRGMGEKRRLEMQPLP